ncbi:MAG: hypothetical protein JEZ04_07155 [Spirochaetales bacterium]|nr:hypothetical protein [Spirochaetales bacterium]
MGEQRPLDMERNLEHDNLEEQEKVEILEEIDKVVKTNRLPISGDMKKLKPQKQGLTFPLLINIFAITAVLATIYFSNRMFEQKQENLSLENASYQSAEGKLLAELKRESEEKLNKKDQEIGAIQDELAELDRQSRELADSMEQQIQDREATLRQALEEELTIERQKLQSQGRTEADIEEELRKLEQQRTTEYDAELAAFKNETEAAIAEKEKELTRAKQLNEELLVEVNSEKNRIERETRKRETELTAQYEAEKATLVEEAAEAEAQLSMLTKNQAQQSLMIDQINGSYANVFNLIDKGLFDEALSAISSLKNLIEDPSVAVLKAVKARSSTDKNMLEVLREKIEEQTYKLGSDSRSLAAAADLLLSAQEIAELGAASYASGKTVEAEEYYKRSLQKIPAIRKAWEDLQSISAESEKSRITALLSSGISLSEAGDYSGAAEMFASAAMAADAKNPDLLRSAVTGLTSSAEIQRESQIAELSQAEKKYQQSKISTDAEFKEEIAKLKTEYENLLSDTSEKYSNLETTMNGEIDRLSRMIGERDQENLRINAELEEKLTLLQDAESRLIELQDGLEESENRYRQLKDTETERLSQAGETGYISGYKKGRYTALEDILYFTSYIGGSSMTSSEAGSRITELAESESIYGQAVQEISRIAAEGIENSGVDTIMLKQSILIGSISYASGNKIIIEPLTDLIIDPGTEIIIKRKERGKVERYISSGVITAASSDRIEAEIDPESSGEASRSLDLVYIIINP